MSGEQKPGDATVAEAESAVPAGSQPEPAENRQPEAEKVEYSVSPGLANRADGIVP
jgi:hypothetical protein